MKDQVVYLEHILKEIKNIETFLQDINEREFKINIEKQYCTSRALEIIGEAVKNVSPKWKNEYPDIPWVKIAGLRDKLIHNYFGIDVDLLWLIVVKDVPILKNIVETMIKEKQ